VLRGLMRDEVVVKLRFTISLATLQRFNVNGLTGAQPKLPPFA
jgi:hypothetical protein